MSNVPKGKLITLKEIGEVLAAKHDAKFCCTLTTGIQIMVAANAAFESNDTTPYWRTLKMDGFLNEKYPGGAEAQKRLLEGEGHEVRKRGEEVPGS